MLYRSCLCGLGEGPEPVRHLAGVHMGSIEEEAPARAHYPKAQEARTRPGRTVTPSALGGIRSAFRLHAAFVATNS